MRALGLVLFAALTISRSAAADSRSDADAQARRGIALYNLGKFEDAILAFEQAYTLFPSDALLFNLAQTHRQLEHCAVALQYYKRFMDGDPAPALLAQVEKLLPKLEAACRTKDERPSGPVVIREAEPEAVRVAAVEPAVEKVANEADEGEEEAAVEAPASPRVHVAAALTAGTVIAGGTAPTAGTKLAVTTPLAWLRGGELGATLALARMWRGDADHDATLAAIAATIRVGSHFDWGRMTIGGEVGAAYFSSLDTSSGVVPGLSRAAQWVPQARAELGGEYDVAESLALRIAIAVGACPRVGRMLSAVGELDLMLGLRYSR